MKHNDGKLSRRGFLKGSAAASVGTLAAGALTPAAAAEPAPTAPHGAALRGIELTAKDPNAEGRFGRMFKQAEPYAPDDGLWSDPSREPLRELGRAMLEHYGTNPLDPTAFDKNDINNENPNPLFTSGVTFVGQFVDHDITFDTTPLADQLADPDAVRVFRTPRYDLDSLYGRGPQEDPQYYDPKDRDKLLYVVNGYGVHDLPRDNNGRAIIGDPRNDQHMIIAQLHLAFIKFHNKLVDYCRSTIRPRPRSVFEKARQLARWHYQWMIIHEFLPIIVGSDLLKGVYDDDGGGAPTVVLNNYRPTNPTGRPFIPVEFTVAAYRFGHSITRPRYTMSGSGTTAVSKVHLFSDDPSVAYDNKLNGSRPIPARLVIEWKRFFNAPGTNTSKRTRQIDARLASPLHRLPGTALPDSNPENLLAVRNLIRGRMVNLASGQDIAKQMGYEPIPNEKLANKHTVELRLDTLEVTAEYDQYDEEIGPVITDPGFRGRAPLWFYILKEAEHVGRTRQLGPVGGQIVAETLVGLLKGDKNSYLNVDPSWRPVAPIAPSDGQFGIVDLLKYAGVWT